MKEAQQIIQELQQHGGVKEGGVIKRKKLGKKLTGGAIGMEDTSNPNAPPRKKKKAGNPLKKELSNPQGLDFANQAGALMAQPQKIEMLPPKDMTKEATRPKKTTSGVKNQSMKTLRTKANVFEATMQGRRSFTFEYEGTYRNPRFYDAKVVYSVKMIHTPRVPTVGSTGYQMYQTTNTDSTNVASKYGPIIVPNNFAELFFEKAVIEVLGGTEIEPSTQTHQTTKIVKLYTTLKPEDALYKYQNLGGYKEKYDSTKKSQLHQVPITIANDGTISATAGTDYKTMTRAHFTGGTGANAGYAYTSQGATKLTDKFNNGAELQFEVPLRKICRIANCQQMFPAGKKFYITLYKAQEAFLLTCQDPAALNNIILQMTDCLIHVPAVELTDDLKEEERLKVGSEEGICYSLTNDYYKTSYIYPNDIVLFNNNMTVGYKPKYMFLYWVDYSHQSNGDINLNNYVLERPNLRSLEVWCDNINVKMYEPKKNEMTIDWDKIYQDFIEWTGWTINTKEVWMNGRTIIPIKIDPSPDQQARHLDNYTIHDTCKINIKQVFNGCPHNRQLRLCIQWP